MSNKERFYTTRLDIDGASRGFMQDAEKIEKRWLDILNLIILGIGESLSSEKPSEAITGLINKVTNESTDLMVKNIQELTDNVAYLVADAYQVGYAEGSIASERNISDLFDRLIESGQINKDAGTIERAMSLVHNLVSTELEQMISDHPMRIVAKEFLDNGDEENKT